MPLPKVTPAHIFYTPTDGGVEQRIDFHAVIFEDHQTEAEITKYPVQTGIHVSNHSIRKNRIVSLEGLITNTMIKGAKHADHDYGLQATNAVKTVMDALINTGTECRVVTNLGTYNPVVFKRFKTKQQKGLVDSMQFNITGEEIIKVDVETGGAANRILFSEVPSIERPAVVEELATAGVVVNDTDKLLQGSAKVGEDFVIKNEEASGVEVETTYKFIGTNPTSGVPIYGIHLGENTVPVTGYPGQGVPAVLDISVPSVLASARQGGISQVADCLIEEAADITTNFVEDTIDTAMGKLLASGRGSFYDVTSFDSEYGSALAAAGLGCIIRGVTGNKSDTPYLPGESLPTTEQIMDGLGKGLGVLSDGDLGDIKLTQIICGCDTEVVPSIDLGAVPPISVN